MSFSSVSCDSTGVCIFWMTPRRRIIPGSPALRCRSDPLWSMTVRNSWLICGSPGTGVATFSPGSVPLIGCGDWNDMPAMNTLRVKGQAVSFAVRRTGTPRAARYALVSGIEYSL